MLTNTNAQGTTQEYNREIESQKLAELFMKQGVTIKPIIPVGNHTPTFMGWEFHVFKDVFGVRLYDGFIVKLIIDGVEYTHEMPFSANTEDAAKTQFAIYKDAMRKIGRQFRIFGDVYIDDLNKHIGETFDMHVVMRKVVKDGKTLVNYYTNFSKASETAETPAPTETPKY